MKNIETERFILRELSYDNIDKVFTILSDNDVITNLNMNIHNSIEDTKKLFEDYRDGLKNGDKYPFEIIKKDTGDFVGVFLIKRDLYTDDCFESTVYLDKKYWSQGICTEVMPYMVDFTFKEIGVKNFRGYVKEKNKASRRVLEKCGFDLEKIFDVPGIEGKIYSFLKTN